MCRPDFRIKNSRGLEIPGLLCVKMVCGLVTIGKGGLFKRELSGVCKLPAVVAVPVRCVTMCPGRRDWGLEIDLLW